MTYTIHQMLALGQRILGALERDELETFFMLFDQREHLLATLTEQHADGALSTPACRALLRKLERQEQTIGDALVAKEQEKERQIHELQHEKKARRTYAAPRVPPRWLNPGLTG